ncbi:MAG: transglycosylase domain-containing protein [Anaerolineales bacterium]
MSSLPILRRRRERRLNDRQKSENRLTRGFLFSGLILSTLVGGLIIGGAFAYASLTANLPSIDLLPALLEPPDGSLLQPTRIYDRSGEHLLAVLAPSDAPRKYISLAPTTPEHLPDDLLRATLAVADPDFYTGPGYSLGGLTDPDQHPTLAQALVARFLLWDEAPGLRRALRERILAAQITAHFGREKIAEWYLNTTNYGHFACGAEAAAQLYFGKPAAQLTLAESALLAAVGQAPAINPLDAPQAAIQHQQETLDRMAALGLISSEQNKLAHFAPLDFQAATPSADAAPAFTALALDQLAGRVDRARIESGGMRVITTLDYDLQLRAACAVRTQLARLAGQNAVPCAGAESLPALPPGLDAGNVSGSAVVIDPRSGQILAAVGETRNGQESAFFAVHRPGTLFTPFIYLAGFTRSLGPASLLWDIPSTGTFPAAETFPLADSSAQNLDGKFHGPIRLRTALTGDYLAPAEQVFARMGAPLVAQTMRPFGFDIPADSAKDLLNSQTRFSLFDVAAAYGVFAAQGARIGFGTHPSAVLRVEGATYLDFSAPQAAQVVSPQLAYLITDILGRPNPFEIGIPAAAKAGQTLDGREAWAVGYTPHRVAVTWIGSDANLSTGPASGLSQSSSGLWSALMLNASQGQPPDGWPLPDGVLRLKVCDPSGMLPSDACPNLADEVFLDGFQPTQADGLYQAYAVNRNTGLLATVFTSPQSVERRVYMRVPPEAQAWAASMQLPTPPTAYDTIQQPPTNPNVHITVPVMFAELKGKVAIRGSADADDLAYYRLQYGQGLNPQSWSQIGADSKSPVKEGTLAEWDTSSLNGLFALQLLVVHSDNSITTATVMVTIKN